MIDFSDFIVARTGAHAKQTKLSINEDWAYIIGLYTADGWTSKNREKDKKKIFFSLNIGEDDHVLARLKVLLDKYGFPSYVRERGGAYEISFNFTWFARWLRTLTWGRAPEQREFQSCVLSCLKPRPGQLSRE